MKNGDVPAAMFDAAWKEVVTEEPWRAMEGSKSKAILDGKDIYPPVFSNVAIGNSLEMEV